jgi:hypothetical protein
VYETVGGERGTSTSDPPVSVNTPRARAHASAAFSSLLKLRWATASVGLVVGRVEVRLRRRASVWRGGEQHLWCERWWRMRPAQQPPASSSIVRVWDPLAAAGEPRGCISGTTDAERPRTHLTGGDAQRTASARAVSQRRPMDNPATCRQRERRAASLSLCHRTASCARPGRYTHGLKHSPRRQRRGVSTMTQA